MTVNDAYDLLAAGFAGDRAAHAYLLCGDLRGHGVPLAERLLQRALCREAAPPCGRCRDCTRVIHRNHPDVIWVEPQMKSRRISVAQVRALQDRIMQTSFEGGWKCCVILAADCLGREAANALLKTLEEPPGRTLFLLLSDAPQFLLPTVLSRCQRVLLPENPVPGTDWEPMRQTLDILATFSGAGALDAYGTADGLAAILKAMHAEAEATCEQDAAGVDGAEAEDVDKETMAARTGARYREQRRRLFAGIEAWYRDLLVARLQGDGADLHFAERAATIHAKSARLSPAEALECLRAVEQMQARLERNMQESAVLSSGFGRLKG